MGVSGLQVLVWALMYYQVEVFGGASITTIAWVLKDVILVSSATVFALLATRLIRWYRRTLNRKVLLFGGFAAGNAAFAMLHLLPDFFAKPVPRVVVQSIAVSFLFVMGNGIPALILLYRTYYGRVWTRYLIPILVEMGLAYFLLGSAILGVTLDPNLRTVAVLGFIMAGPVYLWGYFLLVPKVLNSTAKGYYRGVGYGMGVLSASTCGMGLGLPLAFPLSGFPSLTMILPGAALAFAAFTSCASYFSISEDVRKQIRQAEGFVSSIGEAERVISTERQVTGFYDRFTSMARESHAVEAGAISENEIYEYVKALEKIQRT